MCHESKSFTKFQTAIFEIRQWGKVAPHKPTPWSGDEVQTLGIGLAAGIPALRYPPLLCCGAYEWHHRNFGDVATATPRTLMRLYYNRKRLKQRVEPSRSDWILGSLRWPGVSLDLHEHVIFKACLTWTCGDIENLQRQKKSFVLFVCFPKNCRQTLTHVPLKKKKKTQTVDVVVVRVISNASCGCHGNLTRLLPPCRLLLSLLLLSLLLLELLTCFYASVCGAKAADTHTHAQCNLCEDSLQGSVRPC